MCALTWCRRPCPVWVANTAPRRPGRPRATRARTTLPKLPDARWWCAKRYWTARWTSRGPTRDCHVGGWTPWPPRMKAAAPDSPIRTPTPVHRVPVSAPNPRSPTVLVLQELLQVVLMLVLMPALVLVPALVPVPA